MSVAASPPPSRSPSPEPAPALAQELIDLILDFLHSDRRTLLSASLAARTFVPRTRHHLFRKIVLSLVPHRGAATAAIRDTVTSFLELGASEWWSFGGAVAEVLVGIDGRLVRDSDSPSYGDGPLVEEVFQVLERAGAPLRKVLFIDANVDVDSPRPLAWLARRFPGLTELVYNGTTAPSARFPSDAYELLSGLPELRTLALYTASAYSAITPLLNLPAALAGGIGPLTTLRVRFHSEQLDAFIARLLPHARGLRLETLDIVSFFSYHSGWGQVENLNALLATQARTLRDLTVQIAYEDMDGEEMDEAARLGQASQGDLDLSPLNALQSLHIHQHHVAALLDALDSTRSPSLTHIQIDFREWPYWDDHACGCNPAALVLRFAALMSEDRWAGLVRFVVRVPDFFGARGREEMGRYFPRWSRAECDVLEVGFVGREERYPRGAVQREEVEDRIG